MKKLFLVFFSAVASVGAQAQQLVINSTTYYGGSSNENIDRITPTRDGGFLALGYTASQDGNIPPHPSQSWNALVMKHDSTGALQWAKVFGGSNTDRAHVACQSANGSYAVLASTNSSNFDVTGRIGTGNLSNSTDLWLLCLDAAGNLKWTGTYGTSLNEKVCDIAATPDGGYLMLGETSGSDSDAAYHIGSTINADWLLIKVDSNGQRQWRRVIGGTDHESVFSRLLVAPSGGYYLVGNSESHDSDLTEDNVWMGGMAPTQGPVFMKLSDSGRVEWCKRWGGSGGYGTESYDAFFDARDSTIVSVGKTESNSQYFTGNHLRPNGQPSRDIFLVKVDTQGNLISSRLYGGPYEDEVYSVALALDGGYMLAGRISPFGSPIPGYAGGTSDISIIEVDAVGAQGLNKMVGTSSDDRAYGILYRGDNWIATGLTIPPLPEGTIGTGGHPQGNVFVSRLDYWPVSVHDNSAHTSATLALIPNPARGEVVCKLPVMTSGTLSLQAADGTCILQMNFRREKEVLIPLGGVSPGVYTVVVTGRGGHEARSAKLVVQ